MRGIELAAPLADGSNGTVPALLGLIGLVMVAIIGGVVTLLTTKWSAAKPNRTTDRVAKKSAALELWIALNTDVDPRKIKTGYESPAEVARVS